MKESLMPRGFDPQKAIHENKTTPIWEHPESSLFTEWYLRQSVLDAEDQSSDFKIFSDLVSEGMANLPSDEQIARYKIEQLRSKN